MLSLYTRPGKLIQQEARESVLALWRLQITQKGITEHDPH